MDFLKITWETHFLRNLWTRLFCLNFLFQDGDPRVTFSTLFTVVAFICREYLILKDVVAKYLLYLITLF